MICSDFHIHTTFSDGSDTLEEIAVEALRRGMAAIGFSEHGYAECDTECCIPYDREPEYVRAVTALREQYRGRLEIYCGMEQDYYSLAPAEGVEYVIGSVHYLRRGSDYRSVDYRPGDISYMADNWFGGDYYALAEEYYSKVAEIYGKTHCDIIGHFDLLTKLNERHHFFDESNPRYIAAWKTAADELLKSGKPFEINTGAIFRGYRTTPYPAAPIRRYLADRGACFILSGDSHSKEGLCCRFEEYERAAAAEGLRLVEKPFIR